jgi:hypothetical protein
MSGEEGTVADQGAPDVRFRIARSMGTPLSARRLTAHAQQKLPREA